MEGVYTWWVETLGTFFLEVVHLEGDSSNPWHGRWVRGCFLEPFTWKVNALWGWFLEPLHLEGECTARVTFETFQESFVDVWYASKKKLEERWTMEKSFVDVWYASPGTHFQSSAKKLQLRITKSLRKLMYFLCHRSLMSKATGSLVT